MTAADDRVVYDLLTALRHPTLNVWDSEVGDSDHDRRVVTARLPYIVLYTLMDDPAPGDSLGGASGAYLTGFQLTGVGETRDQAKTALEHAKAALDRQFITFAAGARFVRRTDDNLYVRRDDTWTRPGGAPLFFGVDRYAVLI